MMFGHGRLNTALDRFEESTRALRRAVDSTEPPEEDVPMAAAVSMRYYPSHRAESMPEIKVKGA